MKRVFWRKFWLVIWCRIVVGKCCGGGGGGVGFGGVLLEVMVVGRVCGGCGVVLMLFWRDLECWRVKLGDSLVEGVDCGVGVVN